jgi:hypothetical protein
VEVDALKAELEQVMAELATARTEYASLGAKIAGLEARRAALGRAVAGTERGSTQTTGAATGYRTDAIVAVLRDAGTEMTIQDVVTALRDAGRPHETADNVGVDLAYLADQKRVARVRRGVYTAAPGNRTEAHNE